MTCSVSGCGRTVAARGWCLTHYRRWRRDGDPRPAVPVRSRTPTTTVSYRAALQRVHVQRGPAAVQSCVGCDQQAVAWLYDGADPEECTDAAGRRFSLDPGRYRACCRFCHRRAVVDRRAELPTGAVAAPQFDVERAVRLYTAGASSTGIGALLRVSPSAVITALRRHGVAIRNPGRQSRHPRKPT